MSFDAFYGLSEPSSPSIVSKRKSTDDADANLPSPKRAHLTHEQNRPSQLGDTSDAGGRTSYWMVQWRKPQTKKHKTWDGDGVLIVNGNNVELQNLDRQRIIHARNGATNIRPGEILNLGGKEICIDHSISGADFFSGTCFDIEPDSISAPPQPRSALGAAATSGHVTLPKPLIPKVPMRTVLPRATNTTPKQTTPLEESRINKASADDEKTRYWTAQWRKPQTKKHKSWDGDGYVSQCGAKVVFMDEDGIVKGSTSYKNGKLKLGDVLHINGLEVGIDARIAELPRISKLSAPAPPDETHRPANFSVLPKVIAKFKPPVKVDARPNFPSTKENETISDNRDLAMQPISVESFYGNSRKKQHLHDPNTPNALVMPNPNKEHQRRFNKQNTAVVPVVVDPVIASKLRPHQRQGVTFMYESVMGLKKHEGQGCILADEMGLGKTIQTIALIWTLLRQNPYTGSGPIAGKCSAIILIRKFCDQELEKRLGKDRIDVLVGDRELPLIKQFKTSRHQVLIIGYERLRSLINDFVSCRPPIGLIVCDEGHRLKSADSKTTKMFDVLDVPRRIILSGTPVQNNLGEFHAMTNFCNPGLLDSYKVFYRMFEAPILKSRAPNCTPKEYDEGSTRAEQLMDISRSFVLRRTADILSNYLPPKNEYVVFVRPTRVQLAMFEKILNTERLDDIISRNTMSSLALITNLMQLCNSPALLRKKKDSLKDNNLTHMAIKDALELLPSNLKENDMTQSGKMIALSNILNTLRADTDEKVVIVSHYTATLDLIETHCKRKKYAYFRLDGRTRADDRQTLVDKFNRSSQRDAFIFLLSTKAGGVGLNLIGASRLVLVDSDWNPSHDLQAMARIHRDGQKRPVFIYRLLTSGTIDEKIFQRAITKMGLSESLIGQGAGGDGSKSSKGDSFSPSELRDLFSVNATTACSTHELINCSCISGLIDGIQPEAPTEEVDVQSEDSDIEDWDGPEGAPNHFMPASQYKPPKKKRILPGKGDALSALSEWTHVHCDNASANEYIHDTILLKAIGLCSPNSHAKQSILERIDGIELSRLLEDSGKISFVFEKISKSGVEPPSD